MCSRGSHICPCCPRWRSPSSQAFQERGSGWGWSYWAWTTWERQCSQHLSSTSRHSTGSIKGCWAGVELLTPKLAVKKWKGRQVNVHVLIWKNGFFFFFSVCSRGWFRLQRLDLDLKHLRVCVCLGGRGMLSGLTPRPWFWLSILQILCVSSSDGGKKKEERIISVHLRKKITYLIWEGGILLSLKAKLENSYLLFQGARFTGTTAIKHNSSPKKTTQTPLVYYASFSISGSHLPNYFSEAGRDFPCSAGLCWLQRPYLAHSASASAFWVEMNEKSIRAAAVVAFSTLTYFVHGFKHFIVCSDSLFFGFF